MFSPISKVFFIVSLIAIFATGCSTLRGNAQQKSQKLAQGIQRAYAINSSTAQRISPYIIEGSEKHDVDPILIAAIIQQESNYRSSVRCV